MSPTLKQLHRDRPRRRFVIWSVRAFVLLTAASWWWGDFQPGRFLNDRRAANLQRFLGEIRPWPLQDRDWDWSIATKWAWDRWQADGAEALVATFAISLAAMVGAAFWGGLLSLPAARNFARPRPFLSGGRSPARGTAWAWRMCVLITRSLLVFLRSVPEYVWAFLLLGQGLQLSDPLPSHSCKQAREVNLVCRRSIQ